MNNSIKISTVIFDFDDTLVNSFHLIYKAYLLTANQFGLSTTSMEELRHNLDLSSYFKSYWLEAQNLYITNYTKLSDQLKPLNLAEETLKLLKANCIPIIIISKKRSTILRHEITNILKWDKYFDLIIGGDDTTESKPSIVPVKYATEKLKFSISKNVWFIGDSLIDLECANLSGCSAVLIGEMTPKIANNIYKPDFHFKNHKKILEALKGIL